MSNCLTCGADARVGCGDPECPYMGDMYKVTKPVTSGEPVPRCEVCQDRIDIDADPDCLVQAPDYMPEDFRRRTRMLVCEPCRAAQLESQLEQGA